jgi:hypothetical protein
MPAKPTNRVALPPELQKFRRVSVPVAASLLDISEDSFRRHFGHLIEKITPRRDAVQLGKLPGIISTDVA